MRPRGWLPAAALLLAVAVTYGRALGFPFVYDDQSLIVGNPALADWGTLAEALSHDLFHFAPTRPSPYWRPVVTFSYYLDWALGGGAAWAFHLSNLLALWAAALGLWRLALRLGAGPVAALAAALLFATHPAQVEAASNVSGRTDLLACAFGLWALAARGPAAAAALLLLACGSKEIGVAFAVAAWALGRPTWRACAGAALLFLALRQGVLAGLELLPADRPAPSAASILGAGGLSWWYLGRLLWPSWLAPAMAIAAPGPAASLLGWLGLAGVAAGSWRLRDRLPAAPGAAALILLPLLAVSGLASARLRYGEGFLVVPLAGALLLAAATPIAPRWSPPAWARWLWLTPALLAGGISRGRVGDWSSERALWEGAHRRLPGDGRIRQNLARAVVSEEPARALELLEGLSAEDARLERELWTIRARALQLLGREAELLDALERAAADDPEAAWADALYCQLSAAGASPRAVEVCRWAAAASPGDAALLNLAGVAQALAGDPAAALPYFERAAALEPAEAEYRRNLETARGQLGGP